MLKGCHYQMTSWGSTNSKAATDSAFIIDDLFQKHK